MLRVFQHPAKEPRKTAKPLSKPTGVLKVAKHIQIKNKYHYVERYRRQLIP